MISLLSPKKWYFFKLNINAFYNLQAELTIYWQKILKHLNIEDKEVDSSISILPSSIIVSEALFANKIEEVNMIRGAKDIDLNVILKRLCGMDLFDVSVEIAKRWNMSKKVQSLIQASSGIKRLEDKELDKLAKWMHLLLFFIFSKPSYVEAGLNDFIDFQIDYVKDIYEEFEKLMEIE